MCTDEVLHDSEAEAGTGIGARLLTFVESLEDARYLWLRDTGALIADMKGDEGPFIGDGNVDDTAGRTVLDGVVEKVAHHAEEGRAVCFNDALAASRAADGYAPGIGLGAKKGGGLGNHLTECNILGPKVDGARFDTGEIEEFVDEGGEAVDLLADPGKEPGLIARVHSTHLDGLDECTNGGKGGTQLVRDVAHEVTPNLVDSLDLGEVGEKEEGCPVAAICDGDGRGVKRDPAGAKGNDRGVRLAGGSDSLADEGVEFVIARRFDERAADGAAHTAPKDLDSGGIEETNGRIAGEGDHGVG